MDFWDRWKIYGQEQKDLRWEGIFRDYLELVCADERIARLAPARLYDMIRLAGVETKPQGKLYRFFAGELFGVDKTLEKLVEDYLHPAALGLDVGKRVLLLMGPVGGGKSTIITLLKRGLEVYSRTPEGALYGIKGCPMQEEPLHLVPIPLREQLSKELGVVITGELCPLCNYRVHQEYKGQIDQVPVERIFISEAQRVGIGTFSPSDPKSQDLAELVGSLDFATLGQYGSESDPRAYRFDGELNRANRGLLEFQELLKCDEKFLYHLLSLTQEGNFKTGRYALISADEVIMAHTNEHEYRAFISSNRNEALRSRLMVLPVPYTLDVDAEIKIYFKGISQSRARVHWAPYALRAAALFAALTRVETNQQFTPDLLARLQVNAQKSSYFLGNSGESTLWELGDGMTGIDPRFIQERLSSVVARQEGACVTPLDVLGSLQKGLEDHPGFSAEKKKRYLFLLGLVEKEYEDFVRQELRRALLNSFAREGRGLFKRYVQALTFYFETQPEEVKDKRAGAEEELLQSIEQHLGISKNAQKEFRLEILRYIRQWKSEGRQFQYDAHPDLKEAIEEKLFWDLKGLLRLSIIAPERDETGYYQRLFQTLTKENYCPSCALKLLEYGSELL